MNLLLAKIKGTDGNILKVISNRQIFELPDNLGNQIDYTPNHTLDEEDWFVLKDFSKKEFCIDFLKRRFVSADYSQMPKNDFNRIEFLCAYQTGIYFFQKMVPRLLVRKKYFTISDEPTLYQDEPIIIIDDQPDAIYIKVQDTLYFKKLSSITSIFRGIEVLYREATQEETEKFLKNKMIKLDNGFSATDVKTANRKRIALAMDTLKKFNKNQKDQLYSYICEYCTDLNFDKKKTSFSISNEEQLKKLLFGIEERYYTTKQGKEKRLANSITTL